MAKVDVAGVRTRLFPARNLVPRTGKPCRWLSPIQPGSRYGFLVVIEELSDLRYRGERVVLCQCDCGEKVLVLWRHLHEGHEGPGQVTDCGHLERDRRQRVARERLEAQEQREQAAQAKIEQAKENGLVVVYCRRCNDPLGVSPTERRPPMYCDDCRIAILDSAAQERLRTSIEQVPKADQAKILKLYNIGENLWDVRKRFQITSGVLHAIVDTLGGDRIKRPKESCYDMTRAEIETLWREQGGRCAICALRLKRNVGTSHPHIAHLDHDHKTGRARAFLCGECNTGLGRFGDDPDRLEAAAAYLRFHRTHLEKRGRGHIFGRSRWDVELPAPEKVTKTAKTDHEPLQTKAVA